MEARPSLVLGTRDMSEEGHTDDGFESNMVRDAVFLFLGGSSSRRPFQICETLLDGRPMRVVHFKERQDRWKWGLYLAD